MTKVYVKIDTNNIITEINSEIFLSDTTGYIMIGVGDGDKYAHAQSNYLPDGLMDTNGKYNYKYVDGAVIALTDEEKVSLFHDPEPVPTETEILGQMMTERELENIETNQRLTDLELMILEGSV